MARLFPPDLPAGTPLSERRVQMALGQLDDDWRVFHSVAWQSKRNGRQGDGEADFILLHPRFGLVVLEVKGGTITIEDGQWTTLNRRTGEKHLIKNPYQQAVASKYALLDYLSQITPGVGVVPVCHGVVFPDVAFEGDLGLAGRREITIDVADLTQPALTLERLVQHWDSATTLDASHIGRLSKVLAPARRVEVRLKAKMATAALRLFELTNEQVRLLQSLRRNRRMAIYGPAGSGKTVLALEHARYLSRSGFRVLLVCFNRPLADYLSLESSADSSISALSFHQLCLQQASEAGLPIPDSPDQMWWENLAPSLLLQALEATEFDVDAIVVDEGQDFMKDWMEALMFCLSDTDDGPFSVFADSQQAIYHRSWGLPAAWPSFDLTINCRSTLPIARRVAAIFGESALTLGTEGPTPQFLPVDSEVGLLELVPSLVEQLMTEEDLKPEQCVVLCNTRSAVQRLRGVAMGTFVFVAPGLNGVVVETVHRYKGLEADLIVAALIGIDAEVPAERALAYVALSRARTMLFVLGPKRLRKQLNWA